MGYPDWGVDINIGKINNKQTTRGPLWLQGNHKSKGKLWGGCIEVIDWLKGTSFWPKSSFWEDRILFFETSEEKPSPEQVAYSLRNLGIQGILQKIKGLMFGRACGYSDIEKAILNDKILSIVKGEFGLSNLNIVTNLDFGHTDPNSILPLGIEYELNPSNLEIKRLEAIFDRI